MIQYRVESSAHMHCSNCGDKFIVPLWGTSMDSTILNNALTCPYCQHTAVPQQEPNHEAGLESQPRLL